MTARTAVPLELNLATKPLRNRRFFHLLRSALAVLLLASAGLAAYSLLVYGAESARLRTSRAEMEGQLKDTERERARLASEVQNEEKGTTARVNLVNSIILRKSFSWTALFSDLEAALPASSYITALNPEFRGDRALSIRLRVVSNGLDDLIALINNLSEKGFKGVQVSGESRSVEGRLVTEISLTYEQTV
jgi:Tfp pilus assembly protein PilN